MKPPPPGMYRHPRGPDGKRLTRQPEGPPAEGQEPEAGRRPRRRNALWLETGPGAGDDAAAGSEAAARPPGPARETGTTWAEHGRVLAPFAAIAAGDGIAAAGQYLTHGAAALYLAGSAVAGAWLAVRRHNKRRKSAAAYRKKSYWLWAAWSAWLALASLVTFSGWLGLVQWAYLAGGLVLSTTPLWREHQRRKARREAARAVAEAAAKLAAEAAAKPPALPPAPDPRLTLFRDKFCHGDLAGAELENFAGLDGGFRLDVHLDGRSRKGTRQFADDTSLRVEVAKLYDVSYDQAHIEYVPGYSSERRFRVTVMTRREVLRKAVRWDGKSTFQPYTGSVILGHYMDTRPYRWQLWAPRSGALGGAIAGMPGRGKTGVAHRLAGEAGLAKMCRACGPARTCQACDMARIAAIWMADPQMHGFAPWYGKADVMAWGPAATVELLRWIKEASKSRSAANSEHVWTDHRGRTHERGKGFFDPWPGLPLIVAIFDEWAKLVADPVHGPEAVALMEELPLQVRKAGLCLVPVFHAADVDEIGGRIIRDALASWNAVALHTDKLSTNMLNLIGDPTELPQDLWGVAYAKSGLEDRSGVQMRTDEFPEIAEPGDGEADVHDIAAIIAADPVEYDDAVLRVLRHELFGWTGPGHVITDDNIVPPGGLAQPAQGGGTATLIRPAAGPESSPLADLARGIREGLIQPNPDDPDGAAMLLQALELEEARQGAAASLDTAGRIRRAVAAAPGRDLYGVMKDTGLDAFTAMRELGLLVECGQVTLDAAGTYRAAAGKDT